MFVGYYKEEEKNREAFDKDGWLMSGDIGMWTADGALKIIGARVCRRTLVVDFFIIIIGDHVVDCFLLLLLLYCIQMSAVFGVLMARRREVLSYLLGCIFLSSCVFDPQEECPLPFVGRADILAPSR